MSENPGLICAYLLDGKGAGREVGWEQSRQWQAGSSTLWLHFDRGKEGTKRWLVEESGIDPLVCESLVSDESSPRVARFGDALLVTLRGVNMNPGADAEDMVSLRMWLEPNRIVTVRQRRLMAIQDIRDALEAGNGPHDSGQYLAEIGRSLVRRMGPVINELEEQLDTLEDAVLTSQVPELRAGLSDLRRTTIALRRYLAPQREALARLQEERVPWLNAEHHANVRETTFHTIRLVDDLNAVRERAAVTQDELNSRLSDQMNRTMYLLTLVAAILLPLSLVTGLLGINVGGIPGADTPVAFVVVVVSLLVLGVVEVWLLRRLKWI